MGNGAQGVATAVLLFHSQEEIACQLNLVYYHASHFVACLKGVPPQSCLACHFHQWEWSERQEAASEACCQSHCTRTECDFHKKSTVCTRLP